MRQLQNFQERKSEQLEGLHVCPCFPLFDEMDSAFCDAKLPSDRFDLVTGLEQVTNAVDLIQFQFRAAVPFAPLSGAMAIFVGHILSARSPAEMFGVHAPEMTVAAGVRSVMVFGRSGSVHLLANQPVNKTLPTINDEMAIAVAVASVRPNQA